MNCNDLRETGTVAIVGAGPAGLTLARLLQTRGFKVQVIERDASPTSRSQGGSLDIRPSLGQRAVDAAGLTDVFARASRSDASGFQVIDSQGVPMPGVGDETHEDAGPEIDRGDLRLLLLGSLTPGTVTWGQSVTEVVQDADGRWRLEIAGDAPVIADLVIGADGIGSKVRRRLTAVEPRYTGQMMLAANFRRDLWYGSPIADLVGQGSVMFAGGGKTIFVQRCARDLILVYYSLSVPEVWPMGSALTLADTEGVLAVVRATYEDWSPDLIDMLTQVDGGFHRWPLAVMPPVAWASVPGLTMIGDASHAMPPFTGKGVNLAMFDALELADALIADPAAPVADALAAFEAGMQARTKAETGACLEVGRNFYGIDLQFDDNGAEITAPASAVLAA
jgi:2-polyprenyl-6-methoxyphenol hydroxylase-like FAD-dependent oxidoreductase